MASTYLTRTQSNGNRKTFTVSFWLKRSAISVNTQLFGTDPDGSVGNNFNVFDIKTTDDFDISGYESGTTFRLITNRKFRDTSAWYHVVFSVDTTQATASDRIKIYVNGVQETSFSTETYPSQNHDTKFNLNSYIFNIGGRSGALFDGSMAHVHLIDGTAYDADTFGETDSTTGIWKPKFGPSVTYGTNGFFLKFENSSAFGTDSSGNSNTFTVNGTMTQTIDTPSNVFATMNPLDNYYPSATFSNGNNNIVTNATAICPVTGTLGMTSGKYYWEVKAVATSGSDDWYTIGITGRQTTELNQELGNYAYQYGYMGEDGTVRNNSSNIATLSTYTAGDIIGIALDLDNNLIYFYKNGVVQNSGTGLAVSSSASTDLGAYFPAVADWSSTATFTFNLNFGNGYFGTTAVSSAQNPDDGIGIFEYDVPAGYRALCTKSINAEEYN